MCRKEITKLGHLKVLRAFKQLTEKKKPEWPWQFVDYYHTWLYENTYFYRQENRTYSKNKRNLFYHLRECCDWSITSKTTPIIHLQTQSLWCFTRNQFGMYSFFSQTWCIFDKRITWFLAYTANLIVKAFHRITYKEDFKIA